MQTGIAAHWLMGPPENPPVAAYGGPYDRKYFEWVRSEAKAGRRWFATINSPWLFVPKIAAISSASGTEGRAFLFCRRLDRFLHNSAQEFGFDESAFKAYQKLAISLSCGPAPVRSFGDIGWPSGDPYAQQRKKPASNQQRPSPSPKQP
jgi:hypothetical protein